MRPSDPHILIVDDDASARQGLGEMMRTIGFAVEEAASAAEALQRVAARLPDLMLLDSDLPDQSGREVLRAVRCNPATAMLPIVHLCSAAVEASEVGAALDSGADGYLTRPVDAVELVATVRAVLRARHAEEAAHHFARQWQKTFDAISDGVCLLDRGGYVQRCNRAFCELVDQPFVKVIGAPFVSLLGPLFGPDALPARTLSQLSTGVVVQAQREEQWFRIAADPVIDDHKQLTGAVLILTDITGQKRVEEAMRRSNEELLQANRIKDEFLATLSHELRTPLNAIVGWTRLLRTKRLDDQATAHGLETIDRNAMLQSKLVEDLLDVSRIITGKLRLRIATVDQISIVEAAINSVRPAAEAKAIRISSNLDSSTPLLKADGDRLQQVMWNLLANAVKFTPAGGEVRVNLRGTPSGLTIEVADNGMGIDRALLPYVFDRFRQADSSTTRHHGGLGLGLAIVRHLVELHGGTVQAESDGPGQGACFRITLPWAARGDGARTPQSSGAEASAPEPLRARADLLEGVRLLIVDDDADGRELLAAAFTQLGAEVNLVDSAKAALASLAQTRPHVLVSDIGMPDEDGYALVQRIRAGESEGARLPAIALTAYATGDDVRRALAAGYDLHVAKPVDALSLGRTIAELIGPAVGQPVDVTRRMSMRAAQES